jgi:alkylation response protein AidB-like acyl-CoA dehydrogenase
MTVVDRAAALVPLLAGRAAAAEQARRVSDESFDALSQAGVFLMTAPKRFGGAEVDFQTQCDVLAHLARGCPSTSWVATIYSAMSWLAATFPDEAQEEIFADGDPRISGVFNTGCHGAKWTILNAVVGSGADATPTCVIARSRDLAIVDDWYATGMSATGSNTIVAENVFIPAYRCMPLPDMLEARYPTGRHNAANQYFNYPLSPVLTVNAGGTPFGMAQGALETFRARLPGRGIAYTFYTNKSEAAVTHLQVAEAVLTLDSADAHVRKASALLDQLTGSPMSVDARIRSRAHIAYAMGLARQAVDTLFYASGASSIQTHVPIQRFQRDVQALANHAIMHTQTALELYGRVLCGLPPNTPIY